SSCDCWWTGRSPRIASRIIPTRWRAYTSPRFAWCATTIRPSRGNQLQARRRRSSQLQRRLRVRGFR
ncbi:unnamed protein product, partial [Effrenium voratum]